MKLTDRLYDAAKEIWDGYLEQPFVKELGEGTLRKDRFTFIWCRITAIYCSMPRCLRWVW